MNHSINLLIVVLGNICLGGCEPALRADKPLSPSEINVSASFYNTKVLLVTGYLTLAPEDHTLYESKELDAEATRRFWDSEDKNFDPYSFKWAKYCLTIANPDILYKHQPNFNGKTLVFKGKFINDYLKEGVIDLGACPLPTALIIDYSDLEARYPEYFKIPQSEINPK